MKLTPEHVTVLGMLAKVQQNLLIDSPTRLHTKSENGSVYLKINLAEAAAFDKIGVGFYNLSQFIGAVKMFTEDATGVDVDFGNDGAAITGPSATAKVLYAAPNILFKPKGELKISPDDIIFRATISAKALDSVFKASGVFATPNFAIQYSEPSGKASVLTHDVKTGDSSNIYAQALTVDAGATSANEISLTYDIGNVQLLSNGYDYKLSVLKNKVLLAEADLPGGSNILGISYVFMPRNEQVVEEAGYAKLS